MSIKLVARLPEVHSCIVYSYVEFFTSGEARGGSIKVVNVREARGGSIKVLSVREARGGSLKV